MAKRKWYVVTVGKSIGVFPTWLEAAPLVKGVSDSIYQSFTTEEEARRIFAQEMSKGTTRVIRSEGRPSGQTTPRQTFSEPSIGRGTTHGSFGSPVTSNTRQASHNSDSYAYKHSHQYGQPKASLVVPSEHSNKRSPSNQVNSPISRSSSEPSSSFRRYQIIDALFNKESDTFGVEARASQPAQPSIPIKPRTGLDSPKTEVSQTPEVIVKTPSWLTSYPKARQSESQSLSPLSSEDLPLNAFSSVSLTPFTVPSSAIKSPYGDSIGDSSIYFSQSPRQDTRVIHHHDVDPRSPIKNKNQVPELAFVSPLSFSRPSPSPSKGTKLPAHYESTGTPPSSLLFKPSPLGLPNKKIIVDSLA